MLVVPPSEAADNVTFDYPPARGHRPMGPDLTRPAPLSILFVTSGFRRDLPAMLEATRGHFALACEDVHQAEEVAHSFWPDVVVIDPAVSGWRTLLRELCSLCGRERLTLVLLGSCATLLLENRHKWNEFDCELASPISSSEFEQLLWSICQVKQSCKTIDRNDDEMIG